MLKNCQNLAKISKFSKIGLKKSVFRHKNWKSRECLKNSPKNEFLALKNVDFSSKIANFLKIWVWKLFKDRPKFLNFPFSKFCLKNVILFVKKMENWKFGESLKKMNFWLWKMLKIANFSILEFLNCQKFTKISKFLS